MIGRQKTSNKTTELFYGFPLNGLFPERAFFTGELLVRRPWQPFSSRNGHPKVMLMAMRPTPLESYGICPILQAWNEPPPQKKKKICWKLGERKQTWNFRIVWVCCEIYEMCLVLVLIMMFWFWFMKLFSWMISRWLLWFLRIWNTNLESRKYGTHIGASVQYMLEVPSVLC